MFQSTNKQTNKQASKQTIKQEEKPAEMRLNVAIVQLIAVAVMQKYQSEIE